MVCVPDVFVTRVSELAVLYSIQADEIEKVWFWVPRSLLDSVRSAVTPGAVGALYVRDWFAIQEGLPVVEPPASPPAAAPVPPADEKLPVAERVARRARVAAAERARRQEQTIQQGMLERLKSFFRAAIGQTAPPAVPASAPPASAVTMAGIMPYLLGTTSNMARTQTLRSMSIDQEGPVPYLPTSQADRQKSERAVPARQSGAVPDTQRPRRIRFCADESTLPNK